jgi:hypothetical protein
MAGLVVVASTVLEALLDAAPGGLPVVSVHARAEALEPVLVVGAVPVERQPLFGDLAQSVAEAVVVASLGSEGRHRSAAGSQRERGGQGSVVHGPVPVKSIQKLVTTR